jgi:hypothetical protein
MVIVMMKTIPLDAIMMVVIAVHLMRLYLEVGISFVQVVNVLSLQQLQLLQQLLLQIVRTNGQQANVARSVRRKNVRSPAHVRRTARILAIYAAVKNLARIKKVPSIVRRH